MEIKALIARSNLEQNKKLNRAYSQLGKLLSELRQRDIPDEIVNSLNNYIEQINLIQGIDDRLRTHIRKAQSKILKLIEKELGLVAINHYRKIWMVIGMAVFGTPLGVALGSSLGNMAFIGAGIPIGMALGIAVGTRMDKKASEEGRQLNMEI